MEVGRGPKAPTSEAPPQSGGSAGGEGTSASPPPSSQNPPSNLAQAQFQGLLEGVLRNLWRGTGKKTSLPDTSQGMGEGNQIGLSDSKSLSAADPRSRNQPKDAKTKRLEAKTELDLRQTAGSDLVPQSRVANPNQSPVPLRSKFDFDQVLGFGSSLLELESVRRYLQSNGPLGFFKAAWYDPDLRRPGAWKFSIFFHVVLFLLILGIAGMIR